MSRDVNGYTVRCKVDEREPKWLGSTPISYTVQVKQAGTWKHVGSVWRDHGWAGCVEEVPDGKRLWSLHGYDCEDTMRDVLWRLIPAAGRHGLISKGATAAPKVPTARGPGRPALPPEERRSCCVKVYTTADKRDQMRQRASALGMSVSDYLERAGLGLLPPD